MNFSQVETRCTYGQIHKLTQWNAVKTPNTNTLESDRPQYYRPCACVIAQQYSSANFVSLRLRKNSARVWIMLLFQFEFRKSSDVLTAQSNVRFGEGACQVVAHSERFYCRISRSLLPPTQHTFLLNTTVIRWTSGRSLGIFKRHYFGYWTALETKNVTRFQSRKWLTN